MYNVCLRNPQRTHRHKQVEHSNLKGYYRILLVHSKTDWEHLAGYFHEWIRLLTIYKVMMKFTMKIKRIQHGGRQMDVWCSIMQESLATFPLVFIIVIVIIIIVVIIIIIVIIMMFSSSPCVKYFGSWVKFLTVKQTSCVISKFGKKYIL